MNATQHNVSTAGVQNYALGGTLLAINVLILAFNFIAIVVISRFQQKKAIDIFVLALAISDFLKGLVPVPITVYIYFSNSYLQLNTFWCDFYGWIAFVTNSGSMLILTMMAVERLLAIWKPFLYRTWVNTKCVKISLCLAVLFSSVQSALPVIGAGRMYPYYNGAYCHFDYSNFSRGTTAYSLFIVAYGFSMNIVVLVSYVIVFYKIRNLIGRHRRMSIAVRRQNTKLHLKTEKMFSYLTVVLMVLFWFTWLPFLIVVLSSQLMLLKRLENVDLYAMRIAVINSMLNPIAYALMCKLYRRGVLELFRSLLPPFARQLDSGVWDFLKKRRRESQNKLVKKEKGKDEVTSGVETFTTVVCKQKEVPSNDSIDDDEMTNRQISSQLRNAKTVSVQKRTKQTLALSESENGNSRTESTFDIVLDNGVSKEKG